MFAQFAVRQIAYVELAEAAEGRPGELLSDIRFAVVRGNQEIAIRCMLGQSKSQIEHPRDSRIDAGRVLHFKCCNDSAFM